MSSISSSSRNPLGTTTKDDTDGLTGNIFSGVYMNAGSHASTLDRLYAWERKLYDEVKVKSLFFQHLFYDLAPVRLAGLASSSQPSRWRWRFLVRRITVATVIQPQLIRSAEQAVKLPILR